MTIIVDPDVKKIIIHRSGAAEGIEKEFHVQADSDIVLIGIEEIHKGEES